MPTGNDPLKAAQIVTQRVSVEPQARRNAAEPIGRAFADLVAEAQTSDNPQGGDAPATAPSESRDDNQQFAHSSLIPETDDPSAFLVANAVLSDTGKPVAGLLKLGQTTTTQNASTLPVPTEHAAPTDILVDTSTLFLPPDPNQPIETTATIHSTQFNGLSWPPSENIATLQSVASQVAIPATRIGATLQAPTELAAAALEGGPGANRQAANLSPVAATASTSAEAGSPNATPSGASSGQPTAQPSSPSAQAGAQQPTAPAPTIDAATPTGANSLTPSTPLSSGAATTSSQAATPTTSASAPPPALASAPPAAVQVYTRFVERFDGRAQQFQIRLDPPELGRVNVRIEIGSDHRVHAVLATHDSNALADLLRGQRALEQSLADAGIDLSEEGIRFELSDNGAQQSAPGERNEPAADDHRSAEESPTDPNLESEHAAQPASRWSRSRINIVA